MTKRSEETERLTEFLRIFRAPSEGDGPKSRRRRTPAPETKDSNGPTATEIRKLFS